MSTLSIVVPCYNEEQVIRETASRLSAVMDGLRGKGKIGESSRVIFVDDGSADRTWQVIREVARRHRWITGIKMSRNRGHQNALLAGLSFAEGDAVITVDSDLQDDPVAIEKMLDCYLSGSDVVYGVRNRREADSFFKRVSAEGYYRLLGLMGVDIVFNHADFRLLSRRATDALKQYGESNLSLRGIIPQLGFPSSIVYYDRAGRVAGDSKYSLSKMIAFAWQGISSFSAVPLRIILGLGLFISLGSLGIAVWALAVHFFSDNTVPGWTSTVVPMYLLGGIQLLCIGVIGEYLAKIYMETKQRPRYFIERVICEQTSEDLEYPVSRDDGGR